MIAFTECWGRDGIQAERFVPTAAKLAMLVAISATGASRVEVTSLAKPSAWPQFADSLEVLQQYERAPGVEYSAYVPNLKGLSRLLDPEGGGGRVDSVLLAVAASDAYNLKNTGRGLAETTQETVDMIAVAAAAGLRTIGCVGTAWACPIEGEVSEELVLGVVSQLVEAGVDELVLGDTTGEANPRTVRSLTAAMKRQFPLPLSGHFHDARGSAMANALAALDAGIDRIEGALGGLGGHPPDEAQASHSGNLCTEDFAAVALAAGWDLGLRLSQVLAAGTRAEAAMGRRLLSRVQVAGLPETLRRVS